MADPVHIELWLYPALTLLTVFSGFVDAVAGGGGLITVPVMLSTGLPPHAVLGTNKVQGICGTLMATFRYHRAGLFSFRANAPTAAVVFLGALAGSLASRSDGRSSCVSAIAAGAERPAPREARRPPP